MFGLKKIQNVLLALSCALLMIPAITFAVDAPLTVITGCDSEERELSSAERKITIITNKIAIKQRAYDKLLARIEKLKVRKNKTVQKQFDRATAKHEKYQTKCDDPELTKYTHCKNADKWKTKAEGYGAKLAGINAQVDEQYADRVAKALEAINLYKPDLDQAILDALTAQQELDKCANGVQYNVTFSSLAAQTKIIIGGNNISEDILIEAKDFIFSDGKSTKNYPKESYGLVIKPSTAQGTAFSGNVLVSNSSTAFFNFNEDLQTLSFNYRNVEGFVNLYINSKLIKFSDFTKIPEKFVSDGDVQITVTSSGNTGTVTLVGDEIEKFGIGGQGLEIDNIVGSTRKPTQ